MKCDRNKLKDILKVNLNTLKQIERRNKLQIRLKKVGYNFIDKYKEKNKYIYEIKKTNDESYKKLKNISNSTYNSNRANKFVTYFNIRILDEPNTVNDITSKSDVTEKTIIKWDNTLQDKYINGEITLTELQLSSGEIAVIISTIENKYYFKIKKYKVNKKNQLYMETKRLINEIEKGTK